MVSNFRAKDVALGGQGAPLVSLGEAYLFSGYDVLLNLGGIANVSIVTAGGDGAAANQRGASGCVAFDVCPCNMLLNCLAQRLPGSAGALVDASRPDTPQKCLSWTRNTVQLLRGSLCHNESALLLFCRFAGLMDVIDTRIEITLLRLCMRCGLKLSYLGAARRHFSFC